MAIPHDIIKISDTIWEIPPSHKPGMRVPARIYATEKLLAAMDEGVFDQVTNVATLPGIVRHAYCMPDGHWGYGFPIGGVAAMDAESDVISPGGIGFDINCGMRLVVTNLTYPEVAYVDDIAVSDVAFHAWGPSLDDTFREAAEATVHAMVDDLDSIAAVEQRSFELHDESLDLLLLQFLQEFVYYKDAERLLLRVQDVCISRDKHGFTLRGHAAGERINPDTHEFGADVKAVTLHRLQVVETTEGWDATVILDV